MSDSMLYISHVSWNWIKQRPQFLAEGLAQAYDVTVIQKHFYRGKNLKPNPVEGIELYELHRLPTLKGKLFASEWINKQIARRTIKKLVNQKNPKVIWITAPALIDYVPHSYNGILVYDCMDSHADFKTGKNRESIIHQEKEVIERASLVLVSAQRLVDKLKENYGDHVGEKCLLVRNAFNGEIANISACKKSPNKKYKLCYFGTVGPWFDFSVIKSSLERYRDIEYKIIGPIEDGVEILKDSRIEYTGPVAHADLQSFITDCDCFIMPFQLNEIVRAVDPVKLYEYINFDKNIICVRYPEVERFEPFAELYDGVEGYCDAIGRLRYSQKKYSQEQRLRLLADSTWAVRVQLVISALKKLRALDE